MYTPAQPLHNTMPGTTATVSSVGDRDTVPGRWSNSESTLWSGESDSHTHGGVSEVAWDRSLPAFTNVGEKNRDSDSVRASGSSP